MHYGPGRAAGGTRFRCDRRRDRRGIDRGTEHDYARSLTVAEAMRPDVLVVYAMNGQPLLPQHGAPLAGAAVKEFIDWAEQLSCGIDLMSDANYIVPN